MNPVTLRRLLVFGVCAVGVGALYLVPSLSHPAGELAAPRPDDEPTSRPARSPGGVASPTSWTPRPSSSASLTAAPTGEAPTQDPPSRASRAPRPSNGATAYDPQQRPDHSAPAPVSDITTTAVSSDRVTVRWPAASDDVAVVGYRVWLNGFAVATTTETHATVRWFNDGLGAHVIQVRALDEAGNESPSSPNLLVSRPTPEPTPAPAPSSPSPTPEPSSAPPTSATPTPAPSDAPTGVQDQPAGLAPSESPSASASSSSSASVR